MRLSLEKFLMKLGVEEGLDPYETIPFDYFDPEKGTDFTAGIAMSGDSKHIDCEIQMIETKDNQDLPDFKQLFLMRAEQDSSGEYNVVYLKAMGKVMSGKEKSWFENGCRFFKLCVSHIKKGMIPDFDVLFKSAFGTKNEEGDSYFGGSSSRNFKNDKPPPKPPKPPGRL